MAKLFSEFKIKNLKLKNRIVMAPMCMNSSDEEGHANNWHFIHYAARAIGGIGLIIVEATGVEDRGRISSRDLGIWKDSHIEGLKEIADLCRSYGAQTAIQLGHAGRKSIIDYIEPIAPSSLAFDESYRVPKEMTKEDIKTVINAFKEGARRALEAGFDAVEIHGAHGYLINEFLSPLCNKRKDEYGGCIENRARFLIEIIRAVKEVWPEDKAIFLRLSAEEYAEGGHHIEDTIEVVKLAAKEGIDAVNVSSGAVVHAKINVFSGYQISYAEKIKEAVDIPVIAGGLISSPEMAEEIIQNNRGDLVFLGRQLLREPYWPLRAAKELGEEIEYPHQYDRAKY
ncbi:NADPH dehydrogenase NamA [Clostridium polynesiense]|uniref:NADPH dehydrogenase NamA n=1 Tax=Clostridium polynesiense TaxID=1325933 RepID=UPI00058D6AC7|nr:NADPH dehydrogenase NamA [Clostridium polynesiense]